MGAVRKLPARAFQWVALCAPQRDQEGGRYGPEAELPEPFEMVTVVVEDADPEDYDIWWDKAYLSETGIWCSSGDGVAIEQSATMKVTHWARVTLPKPVKEKPAKEAGSSEETNKGDS